MKDSFRQKYTRFLASRREGPWERLAFGFLQALAALFLAGWWLRRLAYRLGFFRRRRLPCPVVSVGNLTTGGTGKTPVVIALANHFVKRGKRVAILSRGYGRRKTGRKPLWVSDGKEILVSPSEGGDEPVLLAKKAPGAAVVVCADRYQAGLEAVRGFKPDLIILDDGFQRRFSLHRDLDIVIIDALNPFSTGQMLPAGLLREPLESLGEANVVILNKVNFCRSPEDVRTVIRHHNPHAYLVESHYAPLYLRDLSTGKRVRPAHLQHVPVGALAGVANPLSFVRTLADHRVLVRHAYTLDDHHVYTEKDLVEIAKDARLRGLLYLVTTEKDEVKLPKDRPLDIPVLVLEIRWKVTEGKKHWDTVLKNLSLTTES